MSRFARTLIALLVAAGIASLASPMSAQDDKTKETPAKQKAAVLANLKKAEFGRTAVVESNHFLVATTIPEEKAKALGAVLDKVVPLARKSLQYEEKEEVWKGKLAIYFLPEPRESKTFIRTVLVEQPDGVYYGLRTEEPFLVDPVEVPVKATESDQFHNGAAVVAGAFLKAKGATAAVPDWLVGGFGRVTAMRAEGMNAKRYSAYKTAAKGFANKGAKVTDLWAEAKPANADLLANSFADYLAYGPGAANFVKLIYGYRPDDNGNPPSAQQAFEAAGWKDMAMLETAWRKWASTGK